MKYWSTIIKQTRELTRKLVSTLDTINTNICVDSSIYVADSSNDLSEFFRAQYNSTY